MFSLSLDGTFSSTRAVGSFKGRLLVMLFGVAKCLLIISSLFQFLISNYVFGPCNLSKNSGLILQTYLSIC